MVDTAEMVYISSLALLKMLKHGRAGVPMEVCPSGVGLGLSSFTDHAHGYEYCDFCGNAKISVDR